MGYNSTDIGYYYSGVGFGGHAYLKHKANDQYWASINSHETYRGDGFTENFPCSQVTTSSDLAGSPDIPGRTSSCEYFGGINHEAIDIYKVQVVHFLTDKYDPAKDVACGNPLDYTGSLNNQVYYNETRQVEGLTWIICGVGQDSLVARLQNGKNVYILSASPSIEKNTASDLDKLIRGFQFN